MLEFREISINDKEWIDNLLSKSDFMGCEYSFANNLAWRRLYNTKIARYKDFYISCNNSDNLPRFTFPAGAGNYSELFNELTEYCKYFNCPLTFSSVNDDVLSMLNEKYRDAFNVITDESGYDYIYNASDLINLPGKKYHNKRNHLKKINQYNWYFSEIEESNMDDCIEFCTNVYNDKDEFDNHSNVVEQFAINTFFNNFNELKLVGGVIYIDGKIEAVTIGERINSETLGVHIEKANSRIQGCYAAINNEFCKRYASNYKYINREEDLGIEGLRKAKQSYYPCFMYKKHVVTFKEGVKF